MAPRAATTLLLLAGLLPVACFPPGEGIAPPGDRVYFPVGLSVDDEREFLFVVNSDFDLQFNAGTVQSWDLNALRARVPHYCESDTDCDYPNEVCDLVPASEDVKNDDREHYIDNDGAPSHWCVPTGPYNPQDEVLRYSRPCREFGEQSERDQALYPGRCAYIDPVYPQDEENPTRPENPILPERAIDHRRAAIIGAFATDMIRRSRPQAPLGWDLPMGNTYDERLFIPVRGDASLHWIDVEEGKLYCGQGDQGGTCDGEHRAGDRAEEENTRGDGRLGPEPFGIDADEDGFTLLVSNQTSGAVGLFSHRRTVREVVDPDTGDRTIESTIRWDEGPEFAFREGGLPDRPIGVANVPAPLARPTSGRERLPGYLVSFRNAAAVFLLRVYDDAAADPARPYTRSYESQTILTNSSGVDSRGLAVDSFHRKAEERACLERHGIDPACARSPEFPGCEAALEPDFQSCLERAAAVPLEVFISNRAPSSLVLGRSQARVSDSVTSDLPSFGPLSIPLDIGPSRVFGGDIVNELGERERRIFVTCFDSRRIAVYDPERRRIETEIVTGRGPHAFALDIDNDGLNGDDHAYAYVGHFLDSYVGVVDLDQRHRGMYGAMIATVGKPTPPRASK
jgi:hypothetical protein